jgi:glycosyltransferase involved in cell wall biosynthesis
MANLKVSVITVSYNSFRTIEDTIQSIINQTYPAIEYIIIDGGSTDGTIDIIKKYQNRIAYWISERDNGISDAFNKGINKASGEIIGIINSDDIYAPEALTLVVQAFIHHPEIGFIFGDQKFIDKSGKTLFIQKGDPEYQKKIVYEMPLIPHPTVFVRKEVYQQYGGFDQAYKTAMDYEFLLRIIINDVPGLYLPVILALMRLGGESDINYLRSYSEVRKISIRYGYNAYLAWFRYCYKCFKTFIRKGFQTCGLNVVVRWFRVYISRHYQY